MKQKLKDNDPLWYKDAIIYELHVKAFADSNGDGKGDFVGLTKKLDYLENLGVTTIWLLPFYPSPFKDDGYDVSDYYNIHSDYGTINDFKKFLKAAHNRGLKVVTELILNHTSDQHPWFQKARLAKKNSPMRNYYVWSDTPDKYKDVRIIFQDFETSNWSWDPVAKAYYWHRFYSNQPDLNFENPKVQKEVFKIMDFWFGLGVDGVRLDAIPYLFEKEGTNCENLPETYKFLKKLRSYVDARYKNKLFLAEANQWPEDAAAYFGENGDLCHMNFNFPLMPRMFMALRMEDRFPIIDILEQTPMVHETSQWALFLRNHDELTLEMVTDEERDYMYKVYAKDNSSRINLGIRRRLAPLLENNRRKIELLNFLLFSLPGTPVIYYGDEIGMGDNYYLGDRDGVRTPMQWSTDRNAGFSKANPQQLYLPIIIDPEYNYETINVLSQEKNFSSLLWWMKRVITMRKKLRVFGRGDIRFFHPDNQKVLLFIRSYNDEHILCIVNLSRFSQAVEIDLSEFAGYIPIEVFGGNKFPVIKKDTPYIFTLGVHDYFWFKLEKEFSSSTSIEKGSLPEISTDFSFRYFSKKVKTELSEDVLPAYLKKQRWFAGKSKKIQSVEIFENIAFKDNNNLMTVLLEVHYFDSESEKYLLPLSFIPMEEAEYYLTEYPLSILAKLKTDDGDGMLVDAVYDEKYRNLLLKLVTKKSLAKATQGSIKYNCSNMMKKQQKEKPVDSSFILKGEQSNSSFIFDESYIFKLYRKIDEGMNPDFELLQFLTKKQKFTNIPNCLGSIEYKTKESFSTLGIVQKFVTNEGNAWDFSLDAISRYFEHVVSSKKTLRGIDLTELSPMKKIPSESMNSLMWDFIGAPFIQMIEILGKRTGELHLALSFDKKDVSFKPEEFSLLYQRSLYQSMYSYSKKVFKNLKGYLNKIPVNCRADAELILSKNKLMTETYKAICKKKIQSLKIRNHGDFHLAQVLYTGNDFVIIDFEGEPSRSISERRLKRSPLKDITGMIRSFHYAVNTMLMKQTITSDYSILDPWVNLWYFYISNQFLKSYLGVVKGSKLVPETEKEFTEVFNAYLLDKAVYELDYELNNRPDWLFIPIKGIKQILFNPS